MAVLPPAVSRRVRVLTAHFNKMDAPHPSASSGPPPAALRVALIGNSLGGGYGHGLEKLFVGRCDGVVVAIADPHPAARQKVAEEIGGPRQYDDYRLMLREQNPDVVIVATRWTGEHFEMGLAALQAGAHVFMEKPFVHVLAEADELIAESNARSLQFVVKVRSSCRAVAVLCVCART